MGNRKLAGLAALLAGWMIIAGPATNLAAQSRDRDRDRDSDRDRGGWSLSCRDGSHDWNESYCTIEERTLSGRGTIRINADPNGGVTVVGEDRRDIELRARISAHARTEDRAEEIVKDVVLRTGGLEISAEGPRTSRRESWSVSYELHVPRSSALWVRATNGGISVAEVEGEMDLQTRNGGLTLLAVAGDVRAHTQNGGVDVVLEGRRWDGRGLDVETQNGGVDLSVPEGYSAELETGTVNGGLDIDFPVRVSGRISRRISTTLGDGGAPIRVVTTNGGVTIRRR